MKYPCESRKMNVLTSLTYTESVLQSEVIQIIIIIIIRRRRRRRRRRRTVHKKT